MSTQDPLGFHYVCRRRGCEYRSPSEVRLVFHRLFHHGGIRELWTGEYTAKTWAKGGLDRALIIVWLITLFVSTINEACIIARVQ